VVLLSTFIAMVIFVVLAFDRPFRGDLGIGPEPYQLIYDDLMRGAIAAGIADTARLGLHDRMNRFNRSLCVTFIHQHTLKGVDYPVALFRVSEGSARLENPRYRTLLQMLVRGSEDHLREVIDLLRRQAGASGRPLTD
jgi:hypothetical protein